MLIFHILEHKEKLTFCDAYQAVLTFRSELGEDAVAKSSAKEATNLLLAKVQGFSFESSSPLAAPNFQKLIKRLKSRKNDFRPIKEDSGDETFASSDSIFQSEEDSLFNFASIRCVFDLYITKNISAQKISLLVWRQRTGHTTTRSLSTTGNLAMNNMKISRAESLQFLVY